MGRAGGLCETASEGRQKAINGIPALAEEKERKDRLKAGLLRELEGRMQLEDEAQGLCPSGSYGSPLFTELVRCRMFGIGTYREARSIRLCSYGVPKLCSLNERSSTLSCRANGGLP